MLLFKTRLLIFFSLFLLSLLVAWNTTAQAIDWQATFEIRVFSPRTPLIAAQGKFYLSGSKVRIEPAGSDEINLFDFEHLVGIRIFPADRIYFETPLSLAKIIKALKEGWILPSEPFRQEKILLRKGLFNKRKGRLYLIILESRGQRAYSLRWVTDDETEIPLRVIYPAPANETVIVDYHQIKRNIRPPEYFNPPPTYLSLNPF